MNFFVQGLMNQTGNPADCYIQGRGMFIVRDPESNQFFAARNGAFHVDDSRHLVTSEGFRVQGLDEFDGRGDIVIADIAGMSAASYQIDSSGAIITMDFMHSENVRSFILLQDFRNPNALVREANGLYSNIENAMPRFPENGTQPGSFPLGVLQSYALELPVDTDIHLPPPDAVQLVISNSDYSWLEVSTDLKNWQPIGSVFGLDIDGIRYLDKNGGSESLRFYRVIVPTDQQISNPPAGFWPVLPPLKFTTGIAGPLGF
jgi:hypothetical protein